MAGSCDEGKAMDLVSLHFSEVFCAISHSIFMGKLRMYSLENWRLNELPGSEGRDFSGTKTTGTQSPVVNPRGE